jgi:glutathione peroxidase
MAGSVFDFKLNTLKGEAFWLADLRGRPLLIVNTASKCGFTPQYAGLQALSLKWAKQKPSASSASGTTASPSR